MFTADELCRSHCAARRGLETARQPDDGLHREQQQQQHQQQQQRQQQRQQQEEQLHQSQEAEQRQRQAREQQNQAWSQEDMHRAYRQQRANSREVSPQKEAAESAEQGPFVKPNDATSASPWAGDPGGKDGQQGVYAENGPDYDERRGDYESQQQQVLPSAAELHERSTERQSFPSRVWDSYSNVTNVGGIASKPTLRNPSPWRRCHFHPQRSCRRV